MRSSRVLSLLLSVFLCFLTVLSPAAAVSDYWTLDDLQSDPHQDLEEIKGAGPVMDQTAAMSLYDVDEDASMYSVSMMAVDDEVATIEEESTTSLLGNDFLSIFSVDSSCASVGTESTYYLPETSVAGITYGGYDFEIAIPLPFVDGKLSSQSSSYRLFFESSFTVPAISSDSELRSINRLLFSYSGFAGPGSDSSVVSDFTLNADLSSLGEFSSFELRDRVRVRSYIFSGGKAVSSHYGGSVSLYVNESLVKTFYSGTDGYIDFAHFSYDSSVPVSSLQLVLHPEPLNYSVRSALSGTFGVSLYSSETTGIVLDVGKEPFRQGVLSGIGSIFQGILELPGKIVSLLIDGLKSLFIPSEDDMTSLTGRYQQLLSERLGFIWQAYELVMNLFTGIMDALENGGSHEFSFPGIAFPFNGEELVLLPETPVSLDNELMDVIRPVLGTIVCFVAVAGFVNVAESMVIALISGVSYYEFLHGKRGGSG